MPRWQHYPNIYSRLTWPITPDTLRSLQQLSLVEQLGPPGCFTLGLDWDDPQAEQIYDTWISVFGEPIWHTATSPGYGPLPGTPPGNPWERNADP